MMRGMNMQGMMKQMQKLQKNMQKDQEELQKTVFEGHAPDDAVVVKFTGDHKMQDIEIKEEAVDPARRRLPAAGRASCQRRLRTDRFR